MSESLSRREENVELSRRETVRVARSLFATVGYAQTTIEEIARDARVSPATVYAQNGGKLGLLRTLMDMWTSGNTVERIIEECASASDPMDKLRVLALGYDEIYRDSGDIARIVATAAASTTVAREFLEVAEGRHREALRRILAPLEASGELAPGLTAADAAEIVFFHFRYEQYVLLSETFGWGVPRASEWLTERVAAAILRARTT